LEWFAEKLNPKIRGWVNYYMRFNRYKVYTVFYYLNDLIQKWIANKYKIRGGRKVKAKYLLIQAANSEMFYHWKLGIKA
jgi:hypothetical protein